MSTVAKSAGRMGAATFLSRILGLVREQVFAFLFGASDAMDAYNIAFRIPNLLRDLFAEGAMSAAFVPNFTRALMGSKKTAFTLLLSVLSVLVVSVSALSIAGVIWSPELVALYAGSYKAVPGKFELAVGMTRVMFPFFPLVAMAAVVMGALNALGFFFLPAFAPALFNVASILSGLILAPLLKNYTQVPPIYGMAVGVVIGGFLQFYVQWRQIRKQGLSLSGETQAIVRPLKTPGVVSILKLLIPGTIGLAATQLSILINSVYATSAGSGAVSWLNYAFRLMQFPIGIFGVSLAAATLPAVSRRLAENDTGGAGQEVNSSLRMTFSINGPAAAGLMAIGLPIIQLLFQHGSVFQFFDSEQTAAALFWYALGLPGYSAVKVLVPVFYALGNTRVPVLVSFGMVGLGALLNHLFLDILHYPFWCLAAATAATSTLNALILIGWIARKLPGAFNGTLLKSVFSSSIVSAVIFAVARGLVVFLSPHEDRVRQMFGKGGAFALWSFEIGAAMLLAGGVWWGLGVALGIPENKRAANFILKKLRRTR